MNSTKNKGGRNIKGLKWKEVDLSNDLISEFSKYGVSMIEEISDPTKISFYELGKDNTSQLNTNFNQAKISTEKGFKNKKSKRRANKDGDKDEIEPLNAMKKKQKKVDKALIKNKIVSDEAEKVKSKQNEPILDPEEYWEEYYDLKERLSNWTNIIENSTQKLNKKSSFEEMEELKSPDLVIHPSILKGLFELEFFNPTPIQAACLVPAIRDRKDIVGAAETGSGKTLAYGIPIIANIMFAIQRRKEKLEQRSFKEDSDEFKEFGDKEDLEDDEAFKELERMGFQMASIKKIGNQGSNNNTYRSDESLQALVILPSRELAIQVRDHLRSMGKYTGLGIHAFVGGLSLEKQERLIAKKRVQIAVGTPGRLSALIFGETENESIFGDERETFRKQVTTTLSINELRFLVLDEADRLIEQGHYRELKQILQLIYSENKGNHTHKKIQTYLFSATLTLPNHLHPKFSKLVTRNTGKKSKGKKDVQDNNVTSIMPENSNKAMQSIMQYVKLRENQVFIVDLSRFKTNSSPDENGEQTQSGNHTSGIIKLPKGLTISMIKCESDEIEMRLILYLLKYFAPVWDTKTGNQLCSLCPSSIENGKILVFVNSISYVYRLTPLLSLALVCKDTHEKELPGSKKRKKCSKACQERSLKIIGIHGNLSQKQRIQAIESFKASKSAILICTDVLARGLDIPEVDVVVHLQAPRNISLMIHRSGRTARASKQGECVLFCTPKDVPTYSKHFKAISLTFESVGIPKELEGLVSSQVSHVQQRLELANEIEGLGHSILRKKRNNNWMLNKANEADLELSDQEEFSFSPDQMKEIQNLNSKRKYFLNFVRNFQNY
ncbi:MAK5 pre-mRNA splicing RNA SFII helicase [Cryptosporidium ubiquitum]|uniref:ATP-dependent RNA helicase n=1 Tax=Cryptosporidium ubiquitum TaxID=857276 RepID=A0A1J4MAB5_9CRYT|nr:MAK5 pre-mRNA splicing RNA SFII helicase [Cryptosporidium ubiquitum]OII70943.1 MAK5 pre-mRNA splicing RNA SFII helicase [Cryptosporidium ubiquitum]